MKTKKEINEEKAKLIADTLDSPEKRELLEFYMWFPLGSFTNPKRINETEIEWARRVMGEFKQQIQDAEDKR